MLNPPPALELPPKWNSAWRNIARDIKGRLIWTELQRWMLVLLAGLEPAACCLGDVWVQTLCRTANLLVVRKRNAKVILWGGRPFSLG
jgi:hypothetical protein